MRPERLLTADDWARLQELFEAASDLAADERSRFLDEACRDQPGLRTRVESLLRSVDEDSILSPAVRSAVAATGSEPALGERIGPYELIRLLGRGGMGVVYLATRADDQYRKEVAIKLIAGGFISPGTSRRFREERQILANLEHPNIARLLDGGSTEDGSPYAVMEYVDGKPIDQYCEEQRLSVGERLRLFQRIAHAVQYAHQNVVVHRDIKPGNILVTDAGEPKLLDFGIAKLLAPNAGQCTVTIAGERAMTPEYASPEQVRGEQITTSVDIYALGVLLYELLTGERPFRFSASFADLERDICTRVPERPSRVARRRELEGDLDRIVLKALHKEPQRRYLSAAELAADIDRHLNGYPVTARPDRWSYRTGKFLGRHRIGAAMAAVFLALVLAFAVSMAVLARRAKEEARTAEQVTNFLVDLFQSNNPDQTQGTELTARALLDRGAAHLEGQLKNDPPVQARLFDTIGSLYDTLGLWPQAETLIKKALDIREHRLPRDDLAIANTLHELGSISSDLNKTEQGKRAYEEALRLYQTRLGQENVKVAQSLDDVGTMLWYEGHPKEAESFMRKSLAMNVKLSGPGSAESLRATNNLSVLLTRRGAYAESEPLTREFLKQSIATGGSYQEPVGYGWHNLAMLLEELGRYSEADAAIRQALAVRTKLYGKEHPLTSVSRAAMGDILTRLGRFEEAKTSLTEALAQQLKTPGPDNPDTARTRDFLGFALLALGDAAAARRSFYSALQTRLTKLPSGHSSTADSWMNMGAVDYAVGALAAAVHDYEQALEIQRHASGADSTFAAAPEASLAQALTDQGDLARAEALAKHALAIDRAGYPPHHIAIAAAEGALGWVYFKEGQPNPARPLLEDANAITRDVYGAGHPRTARTAIRLAACLAACGAKAEAAELVAAAGPVLDRSLDPSAHVEKETLGSLRRSLKLSGGTGAKPFE